jgi:S1-C subfamily serine protease
VILAVDGRPVPRTSDLARLLWSRSAGADVSVVFRRGADQFVLTVRLR